MAVDTETKRRSVHGYTNQALILPVPDGAITLLDRRHVSGIYAGIMAGLGVISFTGEALTAASFSSEALAMASFSSEALTQASFADEGLEN